MKKKCFTMIELVTVIAIIFILVGMTGGVISYGIRSKSNARTMATLRMIELALQQYYEDRGYYPPVSPAGSLSFTADEFRHSQSGKPYMDNFKGGKFMDAWGEPFYYEYPGVMNDESFDLWSKGPDRKHGDGGSSVSDAQNVSAENSDDVTNWK